MCFNEPQQLLKAIDHGLRMWRPELACRLSNWTLRLQTPIQLFLKTGYAYVEAKNLCGEGMSARKFLRPLNTPLPGRDRHSAIIGREALSVDPRLLAGPAYGNGKTGPSPTLIPVSRPATFWYANCSRHEIPEMLGGYGCAPCVIKTIAKPLVLAPGVPTKVNFTDDVVTLVKDQVPAIGVLPSARIATTVGGVAHSPS